jgi:hypothetical protein
MEQLAYKISQAGGLLHDHKFLLAEVENNNHSGPLQQQLLSLLCTPPN